jgi:hypothetical protein
MEQGSWVTLKVIWVRWLEADEGADELTIFVGNLKWVHQPLDGEVMLDLPGAVGQLMNTSVAIVGALDNGNVAPLHAETTNFEKALARLARYRRERYDKELGALRQLINQFPPAPEDSELIPGPSS